MNPSITEDEKRSAEKRYVELIKKIRTYMTADTSLLRDAYDTAMEKHKCSRRKGGAPYITHPLEVAHFCADMKRDNEVIAAALLHDVVEDEDITMTEIGSKFGSKVKHLVEAVTNLDSSLEEYEAMEKNDVDVLSDVKLIEQISRNPQALYIKVGDRVHNLGDMAGMPYDKVVAKAQHTEDILIPLLRTVQATRLIEILETRCFKLKHENAYHQIKEGYKKLCESNSLSHKWLQDYMFSVFYGHNERFYVEEDMRPSVQGDLPDSKWIKTITFYTRYTGSISRDLQNKMTNIFAELPKVITKKNIPLYDIYFVTNEECPLSPEDYFLSYYPILHAGVYEPESEEYDERFKDVRFMLTIVGEGRDKVTDLPFLLIQDAFGTGYRLFPERVDEFTDHINGCIYKQDDERMPVVSVIDRAEPAASFEQTIHVYLRDGAVQEMPVGSTILDLAFKIHPYVGLCAKYAQINGRDSSIPLQTKLTDGDQVDIFTDSDSDNPENNIIHATIRWFEYVRTREATRELSRYFEKHIEDSGTRTRIFIDGIGEKEIQTGSTVLDVAFALGRETGLHFKEAYINRSSRPCAMDYVPGYGDRVRIETDDAVVPELGWFVVARLPEVRRELVRYFEEEKE